MAAVVAKMSQFAVTRSDVVAAARYALRYINEHYSIAGLARKYGVSPGAMEKALNYSTWGHV